MLNTRPLSTMKHEEVNVRLQKLFGPEAKKAYGLILWQKSIIYKLGLRGYGLDQSIELSEKIIDAVTKSANAGVSVNDEVFIQIIENSLPAYQVEQVSDALRKTINDLQKTRKVD